MDTHGTYVPFTKRAVCNGVCCLFHGKEEKWLKLDLNDSCSVENLKDFFCLFPPFLFKANSIFFWDSFLLSTAVYIYTADLQRLHLISTSIAMLDKHTGFFSPPREDMD